METKNSNRMLLVEKFNPSAAQISSKNSSKRDSQIIESFSRSGKTSSILEGAKLNEGQKSYKIWKFPVSRINTFSTPNQNGRVYNQRLWENVINKQRALWEGVCGLADHPADDGSVKNEIIVWTDAEIDLNEGIVYGYGAFIGEEGRKQEEKLEKGGKVGFSTSGYGEITEDGRTVNPDTYQICRLADVVLNPSQEVYGFAKDVAESVTTKNESKSNEGENEEMGKSIFENKINEAVDQNIVNQIKAEADKAGGKVTAEQLGTAFQNLNVQNVADYTADETIKGICSDPDNLANLANGQSTQTTQPAAQPAAQPAEANTNTAQPANTAQPTAQPAQAQPTQESVELTNLIADLKESVSAHKGELSSLEMSSINRVLTMVEGVELSEDTKANVKYLKVRMKIEDANRSKLKKEVDEFNEAFEGKSVDEVKKESRKNAIKARVSEAQNVETKRSLNEANEMVKALKERNKLLNFKANRFENLYNESKAENEELTRKLETARRSFAARFESKKKAENEINENYTKLANEKAILEKKLKKAEQDLFALSNMNERLQKKLTSEAKISEELSEMLAKNSKVGKVQRSLSERTKGLVDFSNRDQVTAYYNQLEEAYGASRLLPLQSKILNAKTLQEAKSIFFNNMELVTEDVDDHMNEVSRNELSEGWKDPYQDKSRLNELAKQMRGSLD